MSYRSIQCDSTVAFNTAKVFAHGAVNQSAVARTSELFQWDCSVKQCFPYRFRTPHGLSTLSAAVLWAVHHHCSIWHRSQAKLRRIAWCCKYYWVHAQHCVAPEFCTPCMRVSPYYQASLTTSGSALHQLTSCIDHWFEHYCTIVLHLELESFAFEFQTLQFRISGLLRLLKLARTQTCSQVVAPLQQFLLGRSF